MSILRPMLTILAIVALPTLSVLAQEKPAVRDSKAAESFESLRRESRDAYRAWEREAMSARAEAAKRGNEKDFKFAKPAPMIVFSARFLAFAEKDPEGPGALDALLMAFKLTRIDEGGVMLETRRKSLKMLRDDYVVRPSVKGSLRELMMMDDPDSRALLAEVIARNPDRHIQAAVYKERIDGRRGIIQSADWMKDPKTPAEAEKADGKDSVRERLANAEKARIEVEGWRKTLREDYGDLYSDLAIGNSAPEIKIPTLDGTEATLSALRGEVVVLDIWTTWCPPCRAMIPHEREMVERLKDKPFQLVSISFDEKKEALTDFLAKEKMPWSHWWNGELNNGPMENWAVGVFPTIYILDAKGVIRHKQVGGANFDKVVDDLLKEMEPKKTAAK